MVNATPWPLHPRDRAETPIVQKAVWPRTRSARMLKISSPPVLEARTIHPIASRYTDYAIPATSLP
jgi:hypothetical protein